MSKQKIYRDIIFTNHAYHRLRQRSLSEYQVWQAIHQPQKTWTDKNKQSTKFIREDGGRNYHVVAKFLSDQNKYLVLSVWVRGEDDRQPLIWPVIIVLIISLIVIFLFSL
jgi:hypothetical protein